MVYKVIIWDFDGVIVFSNQIRENGFREIFKNYTNDQVERLIEFHRANGGLSRYVKIRFFYEKILGENITELEVQNLADQFSKQMELFMYDPSILNSDWLNFMKENHDKVEHFIASGSDQRELRVICEKLGIANYFQNIYGSPIPKNELVSNIIRERSNVSLDQFLLIGDSTNDLEAANVNNIHFIGYNSDELAEIEDLNFVEKLSDIIL